MNDYRQHLIQTYEELSVGYGRTLITLAGGALGVSIAFVRYVVGPAGTAHRGLLATAWVLWGTALTMILCGYFVGRQASRRAIDQFDTGKLDGEHPEQPGGIWTTVVNWLGVLSLVSFTAGTFVFITYAYNSLG